MAAAMNEFAVRLRAALWWLAPLLVAAALIAWETNFGRAVRKVPPPEEPIPARPVVTSLLPEFTIAGGTAARAETVQRTLFNPTRRPAAVLVVDASKPRLQRGQFSLTGTMIVGPGKNTAFLRETAGGKSRRVLEGDTVNGMIVAEVKPDRVRLAVGDESEELVLRVVSNPRPTLPGAIPAQTPTTTPAAGGAPPVAAEGAATTGVGTAADASLAERRRAARAAQAALQSQTSTPDGNPLPAPAPAPARAPVAAPAPSAAAATAPAPAYVPDPRWNDVYRAYQTPRAPATPR